MGPINQLPKRKGFWLKVVKWASIGFSIIIATVLVVVVFFFVIEPWLVKKSFTRFEGEELANLIAVKGEPLHKFEGKNWRVRLQKFISEYSCHPLKRIQGNRAYVFSLSTVYYGWTFAVIYVNSEGRIIGVEIAKT